VPGPVVAARHELILALMGRAADAWPAPRRSASGLDTYGWAADDIRAALAGVFRAATALLASLTATVRRWQCTSTCPTGPRPSNMPSGRGRPAELSGGDDTRLHVGGRRLPPRRRGPETEAAPAALDWPSRAVKRSTRRKCLGVYRGCADEGSYLPAAAHAERPCGRGAAITRPADDVGRRPLGAQASHFAGDHATARKLAERVLSHPTPRAPRGEKQIDHRVSMRIVLSRIWLEGLQTATSLAEQALEHAVTDSPSALCQVLSLAAGPTPLAR
jgi:hypothetical protein